jgi:hypothetical protein
MCIPPGPGVLAVGRVAVSLLALGRVVATDDLADADADANSDADSDVDNGSAGTTDIADDDARDVGADVTTGCTLRWDGGRVRPLVCQWCFPRLASLFNRV